MKGHARKLWHTRIADYHRRGLGVVGCEGPLAQLCQLEAVLIQKWRTGVPVKVGELDVFRVLCADFGETPRSQQTIGPGPTSPTVNRFAMHARPPSDSAWESPAT